MKQFRFGILGAGGIAHKFCNAVGKVGRCMCCGRGQQGSKTRLALCKTAWY